MTYLKVSKATYKANPSLQVLEVKVPMINAFTGARKVKKLYYIRPA